MIFNSSTNYWMSLDFVTINFETIIVVTIFQSQPCYDNATIMSLHWTHDYVRFITQKAVLILILFAGGST